MKKFLGLMFVVAIGLVTLSVFSEGVDAQQAVYFADGSVGYTTSASCNGGQLPPGGGGSFSYAPAVQSYSYGAPISYYSPPVNYSVPRVRYQTVWNRGSYSVPRSYSYGTPYGVPNRGYYRSRTSFGPFGVFGGTSVSAGSN